MPRALQLCRSPINILKLLAPLLLAVILITNVNELK